MALSSHHPCTNCGTEGPNRQWWHLSNYFGLSGFFCSKCYDKVSHDPYGNPKRPRDYQAILKKQKDTQ